MAAQEKRLTGKLGKFFAARAQHVSKQIYARLRHEGLAKAQAALHISPETAVPIRLIQPVADVVTRANVQHIASELVRRGKFKPIRMTVPLEELIPTQQVVDKDRVEKYQAALQAGEGLNRKLVLEWDGDLFLLDGHHGCQAAANLGIKTIEIDLLEAPN